MRRYAALVLFGMIFAGCAHELSSPRPILVVFPQWTTVSAILGKKGLRSWDITAAAKNGRKIQLVEYQSKPKPALAVAFEKGGQWFILHKINPNYPASGVVVRDVWVDPIYQVVRITDDHGHGWEFDPEDPQKEIQLVSRGG